MARATDNRREHGAGSIVTGETGLDHAGTVVDHDGSYFIIHDWYKLS
jgi:hypothetical protein